MNTNRSILRFIAGLILTVLTILFVHSEIDFFCEHTEECKTVDICLILDKVNFDNHHSFIDLLKLSNVFFQKAFFDDFSSINSLIKMESINPNPPFFQSDHILLLNQVFRI